MRGLPDKAFELAIVDPPYGIGINMNAGRKKDAAKPKRENKDWDNGIPGPDYFSELARVSEHQIIWGGNYFPLQPRGGWVYWDKDIAEGVSFGDVELAYATCETVVRRVRIQWSGFLGADGIRIHPTQKPVKLYEWLLTNYAKPGDRILDTHGGSMSSVIACLNLGFEVTCCEKDPDYFAAAVERVSNAQRQQPMFAPERTKLAHQLELEAT